MSVYSCPMLVLVLYEADDVQLSLDVDRLLVLLMANGPSDDAQLSGPLRGIRNLGCKVQIGKVSL